MPTKAGGDLDYPRTRNLPPRPIIWAAQRKAIWGNRVFSAAEVKAMDDYEHEGEEG